MGRSKARRDDQQGPMGRSKARWALGQKQGPMGRSKARRGNQQGPMGDSKARWAAGRLEHVRLHESFVQKPAQALEA
eukprot:4199642-Prymnesium_polylepis.1